jgi:uncharacterized membrane protein
MTLEGREYDSIEEPQMLTESFWGVDVKPGVSVDQRLREVAERNRQIDQTFVTNMANDPIAAAAAEIMGLDTSSYNVVPSVRKEEPPALRASDQAFIKSIKRQWWWDRNRPMLFKSVCYRSYSSLVTALISLVVTRDMKVSAAIGIIDIIVKIGSYWFFEANWERTSQVVEAKMKRINSRWWTPKKGVPTPFDHLQD